MDKRDLTQDHFTVMTLNLAHGRKDRWHQTLLKRARIESHLDEVAGMIRRERPDIVALQEADGPSLWSGQFDHVAHLAAHTEMPHFVRGDHVCHLKLRYGTAILSRLPLENLEVRTFPRPSLTPPKGLVVASVCYPGDLQRQVDIASVHLDFARRSVRQKQVEEIVRVMSLRDRPCVVMGDLNCDTRRRERTIRDLSDALSLKTYMPQSPGMETFPLRRKRFDWILVSRDFQFRHYETLPDVLSDHRAVVARVEVPGTF